MKTLLIVVLAMVALLGVALAFDPACGWQPFEQSGEDL